MGDNLRKMLSFYLFFHCYMYELYMKPDDIEQLLLKNETQEFLSSFQPGFQRYVIRNQLKFCPYTKLCGFSLNIGIQGISCCSDCSCDFPSCIRYKSCCPDILFNHINLDMLNSTSANTMDNFLEKLIMQRDCIWLSLSTIKNGESAYGYASCPTGTQSQLGKNCSRSYDTDGVTDVFDVVPVIDIVTNELYRNRYCAYCNGVFDDNFERFSVKLMCKESVQITTLRVILQAVYAGKCSIQFLSERKLDDCSTSISDCKETGTFEETACSMYRSLYRSLYRYTLFDYMYVKYQNIFCGMCNRILPKIEACPPYDKFESKSKHDFSFSGLLKLDDVEELRDKDLNSKVIEKCSEEQIYDNASDTCRDLTCFGFTTLKHGACVVLFDQCEMISYTAFLRVTPVKPLPIPYANDVIDDVIDVMKETMEGVYLCGMQIIYEPKVSINDSDMSLTESTNLLYFDARAQYFVFKKHDPSTVVEHLLKVHQLTQTFWVQKKRKNVNLRFQFMDPNSKIFDKESILAQDSNNNSKASPEIVQEFRFEGLSDYCNTEIDSFDILKLTACPKVQISRIDVPWKKSQEGITLLNGEYPLDSIDHFYIDKDHIMVCAHRFQQYLAQLPLKSNVSKSLSEESILSFICSLISIIALCITFFIYCLFDKLRGTIPGKNNMTLILSLFLAQSLYLIGSVSGFQRNPTACFVFGLMIHFSWLVALFWMNICTFHMFRVLPSTKVVSLSSGKRQLILYNVYAILMAVTFVSINIGVSYKMNGDFGYGGAICYISSQRMILYTFVIPTALIVLSNLAMFAVVIIKIKKAPSIKKNVQNERNDIIVFAKLSTITGATWVFGYLYLWTNVKALSYIFIVLNAGQGIFIMLAFVINRRVYNMLRGRVLGLTVTSSDKTQNTTSKTVLSKSS